MTADEEAILEKVRHELESIRFDCQYHDTIAEGWAHEAAVRALYYLAHLKEAPSLILREGAPPDEALLHVDR